MELQRVTLRLTELRCITQSEGSGGSEPYLWVTYFAHGVGLAPTWGRLRMVTPSYDAFRTEFPDNIKAGHVTNIPSFIAKASFDMDLGPFGLAVATVGCIAVLMEEDETPDSSILLGRIAYAKKVELQLNNWMEGRSRAGTLDKPTTDEELRWLDEPAIKAKIEEGIESNQTIWNTFTNQDDILGFAFKAFVGSEIQSQYFDFPEITSADSSNRFVLSGNLSIGPVPSDPVDLCATQRSAVNAKKDEINSLHTRVTLLQNQLQHATPQQKAGIVAEISATNELITQAEAELPALQAALDSCISHHHGRPEDVVVGPTVVVDPG